MTSPDPYPDTASAEPLSPAAPLLAQRGTPLRESITAAYHLAEPEAVAGLRADATFDEAALARIRSRAGALVARVRSERSGASGVDALMSEFDLSSEEGIALMCLAEALLRIPDSATADRLIRDKLSRGDWRSHVGASESLFVNAACWGLVVSGKLARVEPEPKGFDGALAAIVGRVGEPVIRAATRAAMSYLGSQFVLGETIGDALERAQKKEARGYRYSFDMLGEASMTMADADRYRRIYLEAIEAVGTSSAGRGIYAGPGMSVKLSALHPRYSRAKRERVMAELLPRAKELARLAKRHDIGFTIDAEEADRLDISLDLLEALALDPDLDGWDGLGFVIQTVQKRSPFVTDWLLDLARRGRRRLMVRLVKGAYWDSEVKRAQVAGYADYAVFTRKAHTDIAFLACARKLLAEPALVYPQFATHNASTLCEVIELAAENRDFEFQCLHGMGETLYDQVVGAKDFGLPCRIYAPVGTHETLLAYLVRRLLENGANSSFVNQIVDPEVPLERLLEDPVTTAKPFDGAAHPKVPAPPALYPDRRNSRGIDLTDEHALADLEKALTAAAREPWMASPMLAEPGAAGDPARAAPLRCPADPRVVVGRVIEASPEDVDRALALACAAESWRASAPDERARILDRAADLLEENAARLIHLAVHEAGKTLPNAVGEVREAVDFCRYYALRVREEALAAPLGVIACISPWNFPLAIFIGQVAAALAAGNSVVAKPAEQTPLIAAEAVRLLHEAGVPGRPATASRPGRDDRRAPRRRRPRGWRRVHGIDGSRGDHPPQVLRARKHVPDRRDRGPERDDRRFLGASRAGRRRRPHLGLRQRRPEMLRASRALRPGGDRRARARDARRCDAGAGRGRSRASVHRRRADHRRGGKDGARCPHRTARGIGKADRAHSPAPRPGRPLRGARRLRDRLHRESRAGSLRPGPARRALPGT